jgi:DNA glycosylase AlkZ-like
LTERIVVRAHVMRNTVHLVTAEDYVCFRPLFQPLMDRAPAGHFGNGGTAGTLLADGFWAAGWRITRAPDRAVLEIRRSRPFGHVQQDAARGRPPAGVRCPRGHARRPL